MLDMLTRKQEQLGGALLFLACAAFTYWMWMDAIEKGYYYVKASGFVPAVAVMSLALIIIPSYKRERMNRGEDISQLTGIKLITRRWWFVLVISLLVASINLYFLGFFDFSDLGS